ncbi:transglutaminase-like domain-containing protein [Botrimarina hoheduenensis]|uniref:Transglutaminase-like superfamily protein n=1 Tax=Botrimarina hoheduenensis TaxID=2528000 RepID=A0A5C5WB32_9BACT|nr:transglutaminase domain-containing protein [Botrimarina hoheduenensis]TWT46822.1 Transglutaminase-like superfamily protein [Botrimarina hoheduenensis]
MFARSLQQSQRLVLAPLLVGLIALGGVTPVAAKRSAGEPAVAIDPVRLGEQQTQLYRVGALITASRGPCADILAIVTLPLDCPWQSVRVVNEDFSPEVADVAYRDLPGGGVRQMMVSIPRLPAGVEARALVTCEVTIHLVNPPEEAAAALLSIPRRPPTALKRFVGPSPMIEARNSRLRRLAESVLADAESVGKEPDDWGRVEALYEHVLSTIDYAEGPDTSALTTLDDGIADCHGRSALFVGLCRAIGVPARLVWVHDHCYPEFWLERATGGDEFGGEWFPAESAGTPAFGGMPIARTVLQRGDSFRVPERPRERLRYASDYLTGRPLPGGGKPRVKYVREIVEE